MELAKELKKKQEIVERKGDGNTNSNRCTRSGPQMVGKESWGINNQKKNRDYQLLLNSARTLRFMGRLSVTQIQVKNSQRAIW